MNYAGDNERAESLLSELEAPIRETFGESHRHWRTWLSVRSAIHAQNGDLERADELGEAAWRKTREAEGEDHPETLALMANLAQIRGQRGMHDAAIQLLEHCVELESEVYDPSHPNGISTTNMLARCYQDADRPEDALRKSEEALARCRQNLRSNAETIETAMHDRMLILRDLKRFEAARDQGTELLAIRVDRLGADHEETLGTRTDLAGVNYAAGQLDRTIALLEENVPLKWQSLGPNHPFTGTAVQMLINAYSDAGRQDDARKLLREARDRMVRDPDAPAEILIARVQEILDSNDVTEALLVEASDVAERAIEKARTEEEFLLFVAFTLRAEVEYRSGDLDRARTFLERAFEAAPDEDRANQTRARIDSLLERSSGR